MFTVTKKMRSRLKMNRRNGSLLIEALLSVVILSVSMTLVIRSMAQSAQATAYSAQYFRSLFLLENIISKIISSPEEYSSVLKSEQLPYPHSHYRYEINVDSLSNINLDNLRKMTLNLSWRRGKKTNHLMLSTYLAIGEPD